MSVKIVVVNPHFPPYSMLKTIAHLSQRPATNPWLSPPALDFIGWMELPNDAQVADWQRTASRFMQGAQHLILIGIGGSALGAKLLIDRLRARDTLSCSVIDTLDAVKIQQTWQSINPHQTRFIIASKSGATMEIVWLERFFWEKMAAALPSEERAHLGKYFLAITDPHSNLDQLAHEKKFAAILYGEPTIGGRFSIFSPFGLVPALCAHINVAPLLAVAHRTYRQYQDFSTEVADEIPLGGKWAQYWWAHKMRGQCYLQILGEARTATLSAWLEQLIAESTGKGAYGLMPFSNTPATFIDHPQVQTLAFAINQPEALSIDERELGATIAHFLFATAIYGALAGINPFDQPDVESSKQALRQKLAQPANDIHLALPTLAINLGTLQNAIAAQRQKKAFDFIAVLNYLPADHPANQQMQGWLRQLMSTFACPALAVEGPAFLHSIGQLFKGADMACEGLFVALIRTQSVATELPIPNEHYGFSQIRALQAMADIEVMRQRQRTVILL